MAVRTITTKLALDGEAEYKAKLKNLNADLALHKSELEKIQAEYKDSANSMTALGSKYSVMEAQLSTLNEKHKEQTEMLKKAEEAYDKYVKEVSALKDQQEALKNSSSASAEEEKKLAEQVAKAEEKMQQAANSVTFYQKELNRTERDQANLGAELDRTKAYLDEASASADGCATSIDQYGKEVKQAETASAEYQSKIKSLNAELTLHKSDLEKIQAQYKNQANTTEALDAKYSAMEKQLSTLNEKHRAQADMVEKAQTAYQEYAQEVDSLEKKQEELKNSTEGSAEAEKQLQEQLDAAKKNMSETADSVAYYQTQLNLTERDQANLGAELERTKTYLDEAQASADGCATSIDQYGKEVKQAAGETEEFGEKAKIGVEQLAAALAAAGIAKGAKEIAAALLDCSAAAESFETKIAKISTIADTSSVSLDKIREKVIALSGDSGKAADSIGEAVYQAISSGAATSKAAETVDKANKLAIGGFTSVETSVDVLTTALNSYKMQASQTEKVSDILITTQKKGKTSVDEMAQSVGKVIPLAAAYNVQMDNLGTVYAILTANGIATAEATTYTKSMLKELGDSGSKVAKILQEQTGKSFAELTKEGQSVGDVLAILGDSVGGSTTAFNELWSSTEAGVGALSLFNSGADRFNSVLEEMQNSAGATEAAYQKMANTTEFAHQRMTNASDNLRIVIGEQLNPALKELYNSGADAFIWATDFVEQNPWIVGAVSAVTVGIGTLTVGLTLAANAANIAATAQAALNAVMSANPAFLVAAALTALVTAVTAYSLATAPAENETKELTKSLKEAQKAYEELMEAMGDENDNISSTIDALKTLLAEEEKSASTKEQILRMVDQLNEAFPDLRLSYDAATDSINMTTDALEQFAAQAAEQEAHEAQMERLNKLFIDRETITRELEDAQTRLNEALETAQWDSYEMAMNDSAREADQLRVSVAALTAAQAENAEQITDLEEAVGAYNQQLAESVSPTQEMEDRLASLSGQVKSLVDAYQESHDAAVASIRSQMGLFEEMDGKAKTSIDNLIGTLSGQVAYMKTYSENIQKAMEMGVDMGLVRKLSDGKEESAQILAAIVQGGEDDIKALNEEFAKVEEGTLIFGNTVAEMEEDFKAKMEALAEDYKDAFEEMDVMDEAYKVGLNNVQGLINGTADKKKDLVDKYKELADAGLAAYKKAVNQHSPSQEYYQAGSYDIKGLINGAESEKAHLKSAYIDLAETATLGVAEGLARGGDKVAQEADKLASEVYRQNKEWLDRQTKYQKLTLLQQMEVWEAIQLQFVKDSKQYAEAEEQIFDLKSKMQDEYVKKVEEVNKKITSLEKEYQDAVSKRTQEIFNSYKLFDQVAEREEVDGQELTRNLQDQVTRMMDFYHKLQQLSARGVGDDLVEEIRAMGPSAANELDALLRLSDQKLTEYANLYRIKQKMANRQAIEELRPLREETNRQIQESMNEMSDTYAQLAPAVGTAFTDAVAAGIASGSPAIASAADAAAREAVAAAEQAMSGTVKTIGGISYDISVDYSALMANARSLEEFESLAAQRNAKILGENLDLVAKGFSDNSQLLAQWQENFARKEEETNRLLASMAESISGQTLELSENDRKMIEEINHSSALMDQTMSRMSQDLRSIMEAEFESVRQQIDQSISRLAENRAFEIQAERDNMAQAVGSAVREALDGTSVVMDKRKVGELVTDWQRNNARSRGD